MKVNRPFTVAFLALNLSWTVALLAVPWLAPAGTARGLDGAANLIDNADQWAGLPTLAAVTYAAGDLMCHQMESRSLVANGNQYPVDARMLAIFLAGNLGFLLSLWIRSRPLARDSLVELLPFAWTHRLQAPGRRLGVLICFLLLGLLPTAIDGFLQLLTPYESTNTLRVATGLWLGLVGAIWIGLVFDALWQPIPARFGAGPYDSLDSGPPARARDPPDENLLHTRRRYE